MLMITGTDLLSVIGGLAEKGNGKRDGSSVADSAFGTYTRHSSITGATFAGVSQFSEVRQLCVEVANTSYSTIIANMIGLITIQTYTHAKF